MPLYSYRCPTCGRNEDHFSHVSDRDASAPSCCDAAMNRVLCAPMVSVSPDVAYQCPMSDEIVTSMRRRRYLMEKNNVVDAREFTDHWKKCEEKRRAEKEEARAYYDKLPDKVKKFGQQMVENA